MSKNIKGKFSKEVNTASEKLLIELNKARKTFDLGKLTYQTLAKEIGISDSNISRNFRGEHSMTMASFFQYCFVFNKDPLEIIKKVNPYKILQDSLKNRNLSVNYSDPLDLKNKSSKKHTFIPQIINWKRINEKKLEIGNIGELLTIEYEIQKFINYDLPDLSKKIIHSSVETGDGLGYDIKSFDQNSNDIFIEVKTTTGNIWSNIFMTDNEKKFMQENTKNYFLYRIYNLDVEAKTANLIIFEGAKKINDIFEFIPSTYKLRKKTV